MLLQIQVEDTLKFSGNKMKSPVNVLKALGVYRKNNLLDEVLKMYKVAGTDYNETVTPNHTFSEKDYYNNREGYDAFGNPINIENSTMVNSGHTSPQNLQ
mmetsp:Transcript_10449/g.9230  ORF Transcript_10449/g.9230 Transcript_10449/m.9230 type:complete len:100 (+) Transcript_10449:97-396(+)